MSNLSRTHRPKTFADITDQQGVKETLRLEIETGKIGHAYLFGGPRGVGKTTAARIFAKALNCQNPNKGEPCNVCPSCRSADTGSNLSIIEMDAASNNGVDTVRENIIEHVRFAPTGTPRKVYLLDEAHMITTAAWNALLKTLEEPPAYAVFILITTELHKVPATIQSRCQRFDFKRIPDGPLGERVKTLATLEQIELDPNVVKRIVAKSDGCVRDAESLLGQLIALGEKKITPEMADLVLPVSRLPIAAQLLSVCAKRQLGEALQAVATIEEQGIPLMEVFDDAIVGVRQLLLAADSVEARRRLAEGDEAEKVLASLVLSYEAPELADMALLFMERRRDAKQGADDRFCLELAVSAIALQMLPSQRPNQVTTAPVVASPVVARPTAPVAPAVPTTSTTPTAPTPIVRAPAPTAPTTPVIPAQAGTHPVDRPIDPGLRRDDVSTVPSASPALSLSQVQAKWPTFMKTMDARSPSLTFILRISRPIAVEGDIVKLQFQYPYHREKLVGEIKARRLIEDTLREVYGHPSLRLDGIVVAEDAEQKEARQEDTVNSLLRVFGGQLIEDGGATPTP